MQIGKAWNNTGSQGVQSPAGWPSGHRCHYEPSARELFPHKFKTGTAAIVPAASGQSEPEKFAEPGTFRQFIHPQKTRIPEAGCVQEWWPPTRREADFGAKTLPPRYLGGY